MKTLVRLAGLILLLGAIGFAGAVRATLYALPIYFNATNGPSASGHVIFDDTLLKSGPDGIALTLANGGIQSFTVNSPAGTVIFGGQPFAVPAQSFTQAGAADPISGIRLQFANNDPYKPAYISGWATSTTGDAEYSFGCIGGCILYRVSVPPFAVSGSGTSAFGVVAEVRPAPATSIPTLSNFGFALLAIMLGVSAMVLAARAH
jgi:hypothetical protein